EQEGNADKAARLGTSIVLQQQELTPDSVRKALRSLSGGPFREKARALGEVASGSDARSAIVAAMESGARRARRGPG
ncbi:MAG: hypothetical protein JRN28_05035, partial [Nitrososphaerota archaeon]|nr:hypothetical protein [Nitrososphaerota archaeon]